ncbi:hypothetical protein BLJ79_07725 [Arthrobacter sp. UCD-GKA]|nr:hypothetical protein BLJ79_07725 [Arthrobacter sp. UCD-GKA]
MQEFPGETFYRLRPFDGGPAIDPQKVHYVALDGQQRLTSLYHAIYDSGDFVFAANLKKTLSASSIEELEEGIKAFSRKEWDDKYRNFSAINPWEWVPYYSLKSPTDYFMWRDEVLEYTQAEQRTEVASNLSSLYRNHLSSLETFILPSIIVNKGLEPEAIARIFERVNRGGLRLSAFDLMVAKSFDVGWNLRDKWSEACVEFPDLEEFFEEDGLPVIRVIALIHSRSVRETDVLGLTGDLVRKHWDRAIRAVAAAIRFFKNNCGVLRADWLPYGGMLTTLAAVAVEHDLDTNADKIVPWFVGCGFGFQYQGAANTITVDEFNSLVDSIVFDTEMPKFVISTSFLREVTRKKKAAVWRAFLCLLAMQGARDPNSLEQISNHSRPVSIFDPNARVEGIDDPASQLVLSQILVNSSSIGLARQGLQYLNNVYEKKSIEDSLLLNDSQLLPSPLPTNDSEFIDFRLTLLVGTLEEILGYKLDS